MSRKVLIDEHTFMDSNAIEYIALRTYGQFHNVIVGFGQNEIILEYIERETAEFIFQKITGGICLGKIFTKEMKNKQLGDKNGCK